MSDYRIYDATKNQISIPIIFFHKKEADYKEFLSNYDSDRGFLIAKTEKSYFLFLGEYRYKLDIYHKGKNKINIGFRVKATDRISYSNKVVIANEAILITGLSKAYITTDKNKRDFDNNPIYNNFDSKFQKLNHLLDIAKPDEPREALPQWKKLLEISNGKKEFASRFLIQWKYDSFTNPNKVAEGYCCTFTMAPPDVTITENEKRFNDFRRENNIIDDDDEKNNSTEALRKIYTNTFQPGSIVEIPLNRPKETTGKQPMLYGTVVQWEVPGVTLDEAGEPVDIVDDFYTQENYFNCPWKFVISFKDDSSFSVADIVDKDGVIYERLSTDYDHYKSTLTAMDSPVLEQKWYAADSVILHKSVPPFVITEEPTFTSNSLNENQKDAIRLALNAPDFCLIQGPPGSGKTTIITEMIRNFVSRGQKVLVCSKGNLAVDNVLEKWIKDNKDRSDEHLCVRLGDRFKLEFLENYKPNKVTERVQKTIHNQTKQERDALITKVDDRINWVEKNSINVNKTTAICLVICELVNFLTQLCNQYQKALSLFFFGKGKLPEKLESANKASLIVYNELMLPIYHSLYSTEGLTSHQITRFNTFFNQLSGLLDAILQESCLGWFWRLLFRKWQKNWEALEQQIKNNYGTLLNMGVTNHNFLGNPLINEKNLQLPQLGNTPSPSAFSSALTSFRSNLSHFSTNERIKASRIKTVLNDWLIELGSGVSEPLEKNVVLDAIPVIGSTCMGIMSDRDFNSITYDVVIVDEAGQIPIFDILVPLIKAKKVILIGDHLQLPPMDENEFATYYANKKTNATDGELFKECKQEVAQWYNVSLFEMLYNAPNLYNAKTMLNTQYRMHPDISEFISENFYDGKYLAGVTAKQRTLNIAGFDKPIYFYDTCALPPETRTETNHDPGYSNKAEAELLSEILSKLIISIHQGNYTGANLLSKDNEDNIIYDIGVISGYQKQVDEIYKLTRQKLEQYMSPEDAKMHMDRFMISSVDSFQGRDNQIILFSMTRSNPEGKIGFLKDVRRLNVAMTRAKSLLIMVGDSSTLTTCGAKCAHDSSKPVAQIYKNLVNYCKNKNYYHQLKGEDVHGI